MSSQSFDPHKSNKSNDPKANLENVDLSTDFLFKAAALRQSLRSDGVAIAWSLTAQDMCIAALNGGSPFINYVVPPRPSTAEKCELPIVQSLISAGKIQKDFFVVSASKDTLFFLHCLHSATQKGLIQDDQIPDVIRTGFLTTSHQAYCEYLDLLQNTARTIKSKLARYCEPMAELIAIFNHTNLSDLPPLAAISPMIQIVGESRGQIQLAVAGETVTLPARNGDSIINVGAGYNSLIELPCLRRLANYRFVLNDNDPFVSAIIRNQLKLAGSKNVVSDNSDMKDLDFGHGPVAMAIICMTYSATSSSLITFLENFKRVAGPGKPIVSLQLKEPSSGEMSSDKFLECLNVVGYRTHIKIPFSAEEASVIPGNDQELVLSFNAEQILDFMQPMPKERQQTKYEILVASL